MGCEKEPPEYGRSQWRHEPFPFAVRGKERAISIGLNLAGRDAGRNERYQRDGLSRHPQTPKTSTGEDLPCPIGNIDLILSIKFFNNYFPYSQRSLLQRQWPSCAAAQPFTVASLPPCGCRAFEWYLIIVLKIVLTTDQKHRWFSGNDYIVLLLFRCFLVPVYGF